MPPAGYDGGLDAGDTSASINWRAITEYLILVMLVMLVIVLTGEYGQVPLRYTVRVSSSTNQIDSESGRVFQDSAHRSEKERPHLDRATPATTPRNHKHVLVHWENWGRKSLRPSRRLVPTRTTGTAGQNNHHAQILYPSRTVPDMTAAAEAGAADASTEDRMRPA